MPSFRDFDAAAFLRDHWQKRPLLIRQPFETWSNPLAPDELAGLACEPEVESRIVRHTGPQEWLLESEPFAPDRFCALGDSPWTLLVQAVDQHVPEVADLIEPFRFVPDWRIDDVMVSYAADGGGVGPHFDQYDVFLIQGLGRRRWRVGPKCDETSPLLPHDGLRLLAGFEATDEWVLEPGDILYVPPGFAHDGIAVGDDCMTYSVGFRAPSRGDLVSAWTDHVLDTLDEDDRYADPDLSLTANPGEITPDALARARDLVLGALDNPQTFAAWFGRHVTEPKGERIDWSPEEPISADDLGSMSRADGAVRFERNPASRFSFVREGPDAVILFVDGASFACSGAAASAAQRICADRHFALAADTLADRDAMRLVIDLADRGCIAPADED